MSANDLRDLAFSMVHAQSEAYRAAYNAGWAAGYAQAMREASERLKASMQASMRAEQEELLNVCPTCHGRGASVATDEGQRIYYCNCEVPA